MGAGNVKAVYGLWGHLPDRPFRLLAFMAVTSKDDGDPPVYWGGRESMAVGLGRQVPSGDTPSARAVRNATFVAVRAAVAQLIALGAISRTRMPSPGRTAEYALNLKLGMGQVPPAPNGAGLACATGQGNPAQQGRVILRTEQGEPAPEDYRTTEDLPEEKENPSPVSEPVVDPSVAHEFLMNPSASGAARWRCRYCGEDGRHRLHLDVASARGAA